MFTLELEIPHWQALQQTFRHYQCEGWGIVAPGSPVQTHCTQTWLADQRLEETTTLGPMRSRRILDRIEPSWLVERYIKDFERFIEAIVTFNWPQSSFECFNAGCGAPVSIACLLGLCLALISIPEFPPPRRFIGLDL